MKKQVPKGLKNSQAIDFYRRITGRYELTDAGRELLLVASYTLQRMLEAKALLDAEGLVQIGKTQNHLHPAAKCEHDARLSFCRCLKELNLDSEIMLEEIDDE